MKLTKKETEYLIYVLKMGFEIDFNFKTKKEIKAEQKIIEKIIKKLEADRR